MIAGLVFNESGASSNFSDSIMSDLFISTFSTNSGIALYFSKSFSISSLFNVEVSDCIMPRDIKSATTVVASRSNMNAISSGVDPSVTSIMFISTFSTSSIVSSFSITWSSSVRVASSLISTLVSSSMSCSEDSSAKASFNNSSSSGTKPDDAVLTSKPNSFALWRTSADAMSSSLAIWWIRFFAI